MSVVYPRSRDGWVSCPDCHSRHLPPYCKEGSMAKGTAKQQRLEGIEATRVPAVERTAKAFFEKKRVRLEAKADENAAREKLLTAMKKEGLTTYESEHFRAEIMPAERVKITQTGAEGEAEEE